MKRAKKMIASFHILFCRWCFLLCVGVLFCSLCRSILYVSCVYGYSVCSFFLHQIWTAHSQINGIKHKQRYDNNSIKSTFPILFFISILFLSPSLCVYECVPVPTFFSLLFSFRVFLKCELERWEHKSLWHSSNAF